MSYAKYRRQSEEQGTVKVWRDRFARRQEPGSQDSPASSRAPDQRGEDACLKPERMETSPIISTKRDVWSLPYVVSIPFTCLDDGAHGVAKSGINRAAYARANGSDRFFIRRRNNSRPHPVIKRRHSLLIGNGMYRSRGEVEEVELISRFLGNAVFQEQARRCDARTVAQKLSEALRVYEEWEAYTDEVRHLGLEKLLHVPMMGGIVLGRAGRSLALRFSVGFIELLSKSETSPESVPISPSE